jgi:CDP-glucose 4,6-dehydratase
VASVVSGRRVFLTGHTGFKGSWLLLWLRKLGAEVTGYALEAAERSMYRQLGLDRDCTSIIGDLRDRDRLAAALNEARPDLVFHLAAQPLVLASYDDPLGTLQTNVLGTANVLDALRTMNRPCTVVVVTSDKCYENQSQRHEETDCLGGHDLYSASKAAAEIVTAAYRRSFQLRVATARAGNVIGGGDWADHRIVPDCIRALERGEPIRVRNPKFVRPWQHVLEPLGGYLRLAENLARSDEYAEAWNFGPSDAEARTVEDLVEAVIRHWGGGTWTGERGEQPHEAATLRLDAAKASERLGWEPRWTFDEAIEHTVAWYKAAHGGAGAEQLRALTVQQIETYA